MSVGCPCRRMSLQHTVRLAEVALTSTTFTATGRHGQLKGRLWAPPDRTRNELAGHVIFIHGLADHCGRYDELADHLANAGLAMIAIDLQGHGESAGARAYVHDFDDYLSDVDVLFQKADDEFHGSPRFLMGHSMGATVAVLDVVRRQPTLDGLILSSGAFERGDDLSPLLAKASHVIAAIAGSLPTVKLNPLLITHDPERVAAYRDDPLVDHRGIRARTGSQMLKAIDAVMSAADEITLPTLLFHGTDDRITNPAGSQKLYDRIASSDKTLKLYNGLSHETLNELEREQVYRDLISWVMAHLP